MRTEKSDHNRLHQRIAQRLLDDIRQGHIAGIPPLRRLASIYKVSFSTAWKAVHHLSEQGILSTTPGSGTRRSGEPSQSAVEDLYRALRTRIADGSFRVGRSLPKYAYFQEEFDISKNTITSALEKASREKLIYKRGRRWMIGAPRRLAGPARRRPIVLILFATPLDWLTFNRDPFQQPFASALFSEFRDYAVRAQLVIERKEARIASVPAGIDEIKEFIRESADRYSGILVVNMQSPLETIQKWIKEFSRYERPVVLFDGSNFSGAISRSSLGYCQCYYRCFFDEDQAIELAATSVRDLGHRSIGLPYFRGDVQWMRRRLDLLEQTVSRIAPGVSVVRSCLEDEFGGFDDHRSDESRDLSPNDIDSFIRKFSVRNGDSNKTDPRASHLWSRAQSLRELLTIHKTTAWIAPNDFFQQKLYIWATLVGLCVPEDISLVSFDNSAESFIFPLSSIDPGFSYLGYCAAHLFIGDTAIAADRQGNIPSRCRLIDRGSLGPRPGQSAFPPWSRRTRNTGADHTASDTPRDWRLTGGLW